MDCFLFSLHRKCPHAHMQWQLHRTHKFIQSCRVMRRMIMRDYITDMMLRRLRIDPSVMQMVNWAVEIMGTVYSCRSSSLRTISGGAHSPFPDWNFNVDDVNHRRLNILINKISRSTVTTCPSLTFMLLKTVARRLAVHTVVDSWSPVCMTRYRSWLMGHETGRLMISSSSLCCCLILAWPPLTFIDGCVYQLTANSDHPGCQPSVGRLGLRGSIMTLEVCKPLGICDRRSDSYPLWSLQTRRPTLPVFQSEHRD